MDRKLKKDNLGETVQRRARRSISEHKIIFSCKQVTVADSRKHRRKRRDGKYMINVGRLKISETARKYER